jgi:hypothetical protein
VGAGLVVVLHGVVTVGLVEKFLISFHMKSGNAGKGNRQCRALGIPGTIKLGIKLWNEGQARASGL